MKNKKLGMGNKEWEISNTKQETKHVPEERSLRLEQDDRVE